MKFVVVLTTEKDVNLATKLARNLLKSKLAACISLNKTHSLFWWNDEIVECDEVQLIIKTTQSRIEALKEEIISLHSYDNPEILHWSLSAGKFYSEWIEKIVG